MSTLLAGFEMALKRGFGRATILLRQSPTDGELQKALLRTCVVNQVYDPQLEGDRVNYLYRLILETGNIEHYRSELSRRLISESSQPDDVSYFQIFGILCCMAAEGYEVNRQALYSFILKADFDQVASDCMYRFVWLEGIHGLLAFMPVLYAALAEDFVNNGWMLDSLLDILDERDGSDATKVAAEAARAGSPELDRLLKLRDQQTQKSRSISEDGLDYAAVKAILNSKRGFPRLWINSASPAELKMAADDLLVEQDEGKVWRYLQIFRARPFPHHPATLFDFVRSDNRRVSRAAVTALRRFNHPDIRALALQTIRDAENPELALRLLAGNFQPGDLEAIGTLVDNLCLDEDAWNRIGLATIELLDWADIPADESCIFLLRIYEQTPCSFCRRSVVRMLVSMDCVPGWLANEARFDADAVTAGLFEN